MFIGFQPPKPWILLFSMSSQTNDQYRLCLLWDADASGARSCLLTHDATMPINRSALRYQRYAAFYMIQTTDLNRLSVCPLDAIRGSSQRLDGHEIGL